MCALPSIHLKKNPDQIIAILVYFEDYRDTRNQLHQHFQTYDLA